MRVDNRIKIEATVMFKDLAIGDMYEDEEGCICIKVSDEVGEDTSYGRCLYHCGDEWREEEEHKGRYVKPIEATITLHGYKMKAR
jgi:hypothetical protein